MTTKITLEMMDAAKTYIQMSGTTDIGKAPWNWSMSGLSVRTQEANDQLTVEVLKQTMQETIDKVAQLL